GAGGKQLPPSSEPKAASERCLSERAALSGQFARNRSRPDVGSTRSGPTPPAGTPAGVPTQVARALRAIFSGRQALTKQQRSKDRAPSRRSQDDANAPGPGAASLARRSLDELAINTIRTLAIDAVEAAKSGHPGTPMAMAPVVFTLWQNFLRFDPEDPIWPNRDRFVLSNGHASMLLYAMLHLAAVKAVNKSGDILERPAVSLEDIKRFRQLDGNCPGHPEYRRTTGVETTTGPLGQGCGNSVGMALASRWLSRHFNRPHFPMFDFKVYAFCSDGDMMEGVSSEAASLAGHLGLGNLCWIYDSNRISIEGKTDLAFSEDVATRFRG